VKNTLSSPVRSAVLALVLILFYVVLGKVGLSFASINPSVSAIWPPTGFALAALLIYGTRMWPVVFAGAFLVNITTSGSVASSLGIALGNTLEAVIGTLLVNRYANGIRAFERPLNVVRFAFLAGDVATVISATIGVATLLLTGLAQPSEAIRIWITWWMGNMGGAIIFAPLLLFWYARPRVSIRPIKALEYLTLLLFLSVLCYILFWKNFPYPYLFILPLIWSAFRFELRETATLLGIIAIATTYATTHGAGPFAMHAESINEAFLQFQIFMVIIGVTKLTVSSAVEDGRRTGQQLYTHERRFQALIEKNTDAVVLIDPGAVITYASPSTQTVLGFASHEVVGKNGFSFIHKDDVARAKEDLKKVVLHPKESVIGNYRMGRKDGTWVWIETIGRSLLFDPAVQAVVVNFRDITERKELEEAKDDFLMTAAHQLRAPLTAMRWTIESMVGQSIPKAFKDKLMGMYENNQQMIRAVNELLDIARIIQGKLPSHPETVDLIPLVKQTIKKHEEFAKRRKVHLHLTTETPQARTFVDPKHFTDTIGNMISNAIKYSSAENDVTIAIKRLPSHVAISVTDHGIGVPPNEQKKIFTKFYRASNAKIMDAQGPGLGLFIIKSYTEGWGGEVKLVSPVADDLGTEISITVPVKKGGV